MFTFMMMLVLMIALAIVATLFFGFWGMIIAFVIGDIALGVYLIYWLAKKIFK